MNRTQVEQLIKQNYRMPEYITEAKLRDIIREESIKLLQRHKDNDHD